MMSVHHLPPPHIFKSLDLLFRPHLFQQRDGAAEDMVAGPLVPCGAEGRDALPRGPVAELAAREEERQQGLPGDHGFVAAGADVVHDDAGVAEDAHRDAGSGLPVENSVYVEEEAVSPCFGAVHAVLVLLYGLFVSDCGFGGYVAP